MEFDVHHDKILLFHSNQIPCAIIFFLHVILDRLICLLGTSHELLWTLSADSTGLTSSTSYYLSPNSLRRENSCGIFRPQLACWCVRT